MIEQLPTDLIFFVTSRCHLRCKHCFNWQNLQRNQDLSLTEIEALAKSLPELKTLALSGGEPFLRKDLVEICRTFAQNCQLNLIDIPTAGTLQDVTIKAVEEILHIKPYFNLTVGISLDGLEEYHDVNRGVSGTFDKAVQCCRALLELKEKTGRLSIIILTTLVENNKEQLLALKDFVRQNLPGIDHLSSIVARGDIKHGALGLVHPEDLECIDREFLAFNAPKYSGDQGAVMCRLDALRRQALLENRQPIPCVAGSRIAVVYDDGAVAPCEMLPTVGNLRDAPFQTIWQGEPMRKARTGIAAGQCACTHECFLSPSFESYLMGRPAELFRLRGAQGLRQIIASKPGFRVVAKRIKAVVRALRNRH